MTGEELHDFADWGLTGAIEIALCHPKGPGCSDMEGCTNCPGFEIICEMENQLGNAGMMFMLDELLRWGAEVT